MKLLLIDAYALIYRSYYAFIKNPRVNSQGLNTSAILGFVNTLEDVLKRVSPTHVAVGFDPPGATFRHELFEEYKAQREATPEAITIAVPYIRAIIDAYHIPILEVPRYEADDVIGTVAKQAEKSGFTVYMMTPDKDYAQLVSDSIFQYRPKFGGGYETLGVPEVLTKYQLSAVDQVIDLLGLMGDSSDNIPGCPGVGEKTAQKLLAQFGSIEQLLARVDELKGSIKTKVTENREQILLSKHLATIVTDVPISFDAETALLKAPDTTRLLPIYQELEFRAQIKKMEGTPQQSTRSDSPSAQLSFFDAMVDDQPEEVPVPENLSDAATTPHTYHLVDTPAARNALVEKLSTASAFAFDTETDGIKPLTAQLVGLSFAIHEGEAWYLPMPESFEEVVQELSPFKSILQSGERTIIGQNIKFDILVLDKYGIKVQGPLFDTMIAHYLLHPELRHGMDYLAETYLHYRTIAIETLIGPKRKQQGSMREVDHHVICEYAAEDADITLKLQALFAPKLKEQGLDFLFHQMEMPLISVLANMELAGVTLDTETLKRSSHLLTEQLLLIEHDIFEMAGSSFNINSFKQVGEVLFDHLKIDEKAKKTKTGSYSTNEEVLTKLRNRHPIVEKLLDYRGIKKLLSTYVDALPLLINPQTGKIHTSYNQAVTTTGRLSSTQPNLQNIPIRDAMGREIRKAFTADNRECLFFSADYSQIELRVMAHLSEDAGMIDAFLKGLDIHTATAAKIFAVNPEQVTQEMRRKAKTANFGIIYGISVFGLSERLNIPRAESKALIDGYFNSYPDVKNYMDQAINEAKERGYVETIFHRRRLLPDIHSHNAVVRGYAERNAINAPIQGSAADIIKLAMIRIEERFKRESLRSRMILQVHDELNFNVWKDELASVKSIVIEEMEGVVELKVPLLVECGVGDNWLEAH